MFGLKLCFLRNFFLAVLTGTLTSTLYRPCSLVQLSVDERMGVEAAYACYGKEAMPAAPHDFVRLVYGEEGRGGTRPLIR